MPVTDGPYSRWHKLASCLVSRTTVPQGETPATHNRSAQTGCYSIFKSEKSVQVIGWQKVSL
ncbi:UNVERIFIED_CONTAM: hypothetical protein FKN15_044614 [Acipenser sinensis]